MTRHKYRHKCQRGCHITCMALSKRTLVCARPAQSSVLLYRRSRTGGSNPDPKTRLTLDQHIEVRIRGGAATLPACSSPDTAERNRYFGSNTWCGRIPAAAQPGRPKWNQVASRYRYFRLLHSEYDRLGLGTYSLYALKCLANREISPSRFSASSLGEPCLQPFQT